jgi:hypothetical protein
MDAIKTIGDHERYARCIQSSNKVRRDIDEDVIRGRLFDTATCAALFGGREDLVKEAIDARDESKDNYSERELTEERFLEQFAALEESLTLLQSHMHNMSENAKLLGSLARHIRRSTCPTTGHLRKQELDFPPEPY